MTNQAKWLVAVPFILGLVWVVPGAIARDACWFIADWQAAVFATLSAGMWVGATAFVDVENMPRGKGVERRLISLAFIFSIPLVVWDRVHGLSRLSGVGWGVAGLLVCGLGVAIGLWARSTLGRYYVPEVHIAEGQELIEAGPYRWVRHPIYTAALLWAVGLPLIMGSLVGALFTLALLGPALWLRIRKEEQALMTAFGERYTAYRARTGFLFPFL